MRIVEKMFQEYDDTIVTLSKQLGLSSILLARCNYLGDKYYEVDKLRAVKKKLNDHGLEVEAIENVPMDQIYKVLFGLDGRDEQIENYIKTIRNMGAAGIPVLGLAFMPTQVWRTDMEAPGRASSLVSAYDHELMPLGNKCSNVTLLSDKKLDRQEIWDNFTYFVKTIMPEAEKAGVRIALHPDDPPVEEVGGVARLLVTVDDFRRAVEVANSDNFGLDLCLGCFSEMEGGAKRVYEAIDTFGPMGKIFYVHMRDVQGCVPQFKECYIDEGNYNPAVALCKLRQAGFDGFINDDHVPEMIGGGGSLLASRCYAVGYLKGLLRMAETLEANPEFCANC